MNTPVVPIIPQDRYFPEYFDSSMMGSFKSCPSLFRMTYIDEWKAKGLSVHLHAGKAFARGLEVARKAFFLGEYEFHVQTGTDHTTGKPIMMLQSNQLEPGDSEGSIACGLGELLHAYGTFECPADSAKSADRTAGAYEFYFANYPLTLNDQDPVILPGGKRGIEFSFAHPLPIAHPITGNPLLYVGRLDMIMNYAGKVFMEDDKTTTALGASWSRQWDLRAQFTGYKWGCEQSGIPVEGVIVRGVSILKTKYDTQEAISYRPDWQVDRWYNEMLDWIEDIKMAWTTGRWRHNLDHSCAEYGGCAFRQVCSSQDEAPWLDTYFEKRHWNPLLRTEEKL